jgi:hypothetical protein
MYPTLWIIQASSNFFLQSGLNNLMEKLSQFLSGVILNAQNNSKLAEIYNSVVNKKEGQDSQNRKMN